MMSSWGGGGGGENLEKTRKLRDDIIQICNSAQLPLRKWASNAPELVCDLSEEPNMVSIDLPFNEGQNVQVLGIRWNPVSDVFQYKAKLEWNAGKLTKRTILSKVSKIFDPMEWISPIIIQAKILLQGLWLLKVDWDAPLPPHIRRQWKLFVDSWYSVDQISIPRWTLSSPNSTYEVHGFCDASEKAYGAVIYLRVIDGSSSTATLLMSKTRVSPLKTVSLPRLELCAASLLADLVKYVLSVLDLGQVPVYCWSDSSITLSWMQQHGKFL